MGGASKILLCWSATALTYKLFSRGSVVWKHSWILPVTTNPIICKKWVEECSKTTWRIMMSAIGLAKHEVELSKQKTSLFGMFVEYNKCSTKIIARIYGLLMGFWSKQYPTKKLKIAQIQTSGCLFSNIHFIRRIWQLVAKLCFQLSLPLHIPLVIFSIWRFILPLFLCILGFIYFFP